MYIKYNISYVLSENYNHYFEATESFSQMVFFLCVPDSLLEHLLTDFDETFGVYRVDSELVQRHIFDFRFHPQTGNELFFP